MPVAQQRSLTANTFIDLFAGCGGLSLGLMKSGWKGIFAIEKDKLAFETLRHNLIRRQNELRYAWPRWLVKQPWRIGAFIKNNREKIAGLRGRVTLIAGGPPCQGYSLAGRRNKRDARNQLFRHYIEVVELIQPAFLLLENVRGIEVEFGKKKRQSENRRKVGRPAKPYSHLIKEKLEALDYRVFSSLVTAADYGVPQYRPRYYMLAIHRSVLSEDLALDPFAQLANSREQFLQTRGLPLERPVSTREAISDLECSGKQLVDCPDSPGFLQPQYGGPGTAYQLLAHGSLNGTAPNSMRLAKHREQTVIRFARILETCRHGVQLSEADRKRFGLKKHCTVPLDQDKPSHTLTTLPDDILHYSEPRILSVREYARLQSFPDWFEFKGKYTTGGNKRTRECPRYTQVGNAVPPLVAEAIGLLLQSIRQQLPPIGRASTR